MKNLLFIFCLFGGMLAHAQSGYFGSRSSIDFTIGVGPSFSRVSRLVDLTQQEKVFHQRLRLANLNYRLGYSFVAANKVEVGIAYEYARMRSYSLDARVRQGPGLSGSNQAFNLFEDVVMNKHGIRLKTLIFIKGSKAPIGKYFGFSTNLGTVSVANDSITYGQRGVSQNNSGFFTRKNDVVSEFQDNVRLAPVRGYYLAFRGTLGHNYPINKKMLLKVSLDFPLISVLTNSLDTKIGAFYVFNPLDDDIDDLVEGESIRIDNGDVNDLLLYTTHKYNRIQLEIGLRYQL